MRKNVVKTFVACAAACLVAGVVAMGGVNDSVKADGEVICDYNFNDGNLGDCYGNNSKLEIVEGMNSNYVGDGMQEGTGTDGSCVKVSARKEYWETSAFAYNVEKLDANKKYVLSYDIYHDNQATDKYSTNRAVIAHTQPNWGQIGQPHTAPSGEWERCVETFVLNEVSSSGNTYIYLEFAYPEQTDQNENNSYKDNNLETYYIDNFSIKEYVEPTPTPKPTATPVPTPEPTPVAAIPTPFVPVEDEGLDVGYEEAVKGIMYVVTGKDTVSVKGFDEASSKLVIPATVAIEGYTYKVTDIAKNAFKGETIKSATIGANVTTIGASAFYKCKSLKTITIKSTVIKKIGSKAFKNTNAKATVKVPKAKKAAYKKLLKKAGLSAKAKVK